MAVTLWIDRTQATGYRVPSYGAEEPGVKPVEAGGDIATGRIEKENKEGRKEGRKEGGGREDEGQ